MPLRLKMIDRSDFTIAGLATFFGLCAQQALGAWLALPLSVQTLLQGLITIALGLLLVVAQHFLRRFLKRNWPEDAKVDQAEPARAIRLAAARVDWFKVLRPVARPLFNLVRGAVSRLRRRKES